MFYKVYVLCILKDDYFNNRDKFKDINILKVLYFNEFVVLMIYVFNRSIYYYINYMKNNFSISVFYSKRYILSLEEVEQYEIDDYTKRYLQIISNYFRRKL